MARSVRENTALDALQRSLDEGVTGQLNVGSDDDAVQVYVQGGQILAAESPRDITLLLRRLLIERVLPPTRVRDLKNRFRAGENVWGDLLEGLPAERIDPVLYDRFRDNLADFCGRQEAPRFKKLGAIFVDNLQFGRIPAAEVASAWSTWQLASKVQPHDKLTAGNAPPQDAMQARLVRRLDEPAAAGLLLEALPVEPITGRAWLATLIEAGILSLVRDLPQVAEPQQDQLEEPTEMVDRDDIARQASEVPVDEGNEDEGHEDEEDDEPILDDPSLIDQPESAGAGNVSSFQAWMDHDVDVDDAFLDAFADHDSDRGGSGEGGFSTEQHNLDRVEVAPLDDVSDLVDAPPPEEEVIEVDGAPQARFSAPVLSDKEAYAKLDVANDVLRVIATAFDEAQGPGFGKEQLQLLCDGSPSRFADLFHGVRLYKDGALPRKQILRNLVSRPPTEHRPLLNQGLVDLLDRALSFAADELTDDDVVDHVLEQVAGYRQRLGL